MAKARGACRGAGGMGWGDPVLHNSSWKQGEGSSGSMQLWEGAYSGWMLYRRARGLHRMGICLQEMQGWKVKYISVGLLSSEGEDTGMYKRDPYRQQTGSAGRMRRGKRLNKAPE